MHIEKSIKAKLNEFLALCNTYGVKNLYAFGSSISDDFNETSDIDLLIELKTTDPIEKGNNLLNIWDKFEGFFQRKVDLLTDSSLRNPFLKKSIEDSKILIYDGEKILV